MHVVTSWPSTLTSAVVRTTEQSGWRGSQAGTSDVRLGHDKKGNKDERMVQLLDDASFQNKGASSCSLSTV